MEIPSALRRGSNCHQTFRTSSLTSSIFAFAFAIAIDSPLNRQKVASGLAISRSFRSCCLMAKAPSVIERGPHSLVQHGQQGRAGSDAAI